MKPRRKVERTDSAITPVSCPHCKAPNPPLTQLCSRCGRPLAPAPKPTPASRKGGSLMAFISYLPALFLCCLILVHLLTWPPQLENLGQLAVLGWVGVACLTIACARVLRLLGAPPESIQGLGGVSLACSVSLLPLWMGLGYLIQVRLFYFLSYALLLSAGCVLLALWPHKPKKPEKGVELPLPPVPVGPSELEKVQKKLLSYIKEHGGVIERKKCLVDLGLTDNLFLVAVRGLEKSGKLKLKEGNLI
ncbi:MAG: zinc ribbon domain-containing protein [Candidatus Hadarchaeales archaeon]